MAKYLQCQDLTQMSEITDIRLLPDKGGAKIELEQQKSYHFQKKCMSRFFSSNECNLVLQFLLFAYVYITTTYFGINKVLSNQIESDLIRLSTKVIREIVTSCKSK